jgi:CBS domain-containing protein
MVRAKGVIRMKARDVMSNELYTIRLEATLEQAAKTMKEQNVGMLPVVSSEGKAIGTVTDRDITVRAVAIGLEPERTQVKDVMSPGLEICYSDDAVTEVAKRMNEKHVRRMIVVERANRRLAGVISVGDLARRGEDRNLASDALAKEAARGG